MDNGFSAVYVQKNGLFNSKKLNITLSFHDTTITGNGLKLSEDMGFVHQALNVEYNSIKNYEECDFENGKALKIDTYVLLHGNYWNDATFFRLNLSL